MLRFATLAASIVLSLSANCSAADLAGQATVIDGDTIEIHGTRIRLYGIDAPESGQTCEAAGKIYRCGQQAALALADHIGRYAVSCTSKGDPDRYGRMIAACTAAGEDLGAWLVSNGLAVAYRRYSLDYVDEEQRAQASSLGVWRGEFVAPWDWRKGVR